MTKTTSQPISCFMCLQQADLARAQQHRAAALRSLLKILLKLLPLPVFVAYLFYTQRVRWSLRNCDTWVASVVLLIFVTLYVALSGPSGCFASKVRTDFAFCHIQFFAEGAYCHNLRHNLAQVRGGGGAAAARGRDAQDGGVVGPCDHACC